MSTTSVAFTGSSQFSADLQQVLQRAVSIASLPITLLQNDQATLQSQQTALQSIDSTFSALQTALNNIETAATGGSFSVGSSDSSVAQATAGSSALPGSYSLNVIDTGSFSSSLSGDTLPKVTDPNTQSISSSPAFTLTVDGSTFTVNPSANTLTSLAQAINTSGAGVSATIINLGSPSSPDYRLAIASTKLGPVSLQLNDGTTELLNTLTTGTLAQYQVNGQPSTPIASDSPTVTLAPGLTVQLQGAGQTTITISRSWQNLSDALSAFATAYNSAVSELNQSRGQTNSPLAGDSLLFTLSQAVQTLGGYANGSSGVSSLTDLGLTFNKDGTLSFDADQFASVTSTNPDQVLSLLGSSTTGGFLQMASNTLNQLEDPNSGAIQVELTSVAQQIQDDSNKIQDEQQRVDFLQQDLSSRLAAADALIASLEQQATFFQNMFATMNANNNAGK